MLWLLCCRLLKDDTFADAGYILEMMTQVRQLLATLAQLHGYPCYMLTPW